MRGHATSCDLCGTGNVGVPAPRIVVSNPTLELAAVTVANPAKVGRNAGEFS